MKSYIPKALAVVAATAYLALATLGPKAQEARDAIEPLWEQFESVAHNAPSRTVKIEGFDTTKVLDYNGKLQEIVEQRNQVLADYGASHLGLWKVTRPGGSTERETLDQLVVFTANPF